MFFQSVSNLYLFIFTCPILLQYFYRIIRDALFVINCGPAHIDEESIPVRGHRRIVILDFEFPWNAQLQNWPIVSLSKASGFPKIL